MARAIVVPAYGGPEVLTEVEVGVPEPAAGQVLVRVRAAGVNPVDCKIRRGAFAGPDDGFPQRLGNEFAGTITAVGPGVDSSVAGQDVLGLTTMQAYAEAVVVAADQVVPKPAGLEWAVAGALSAAGQMAYHALEELRITEGETVLVHAAAGGVGTMAVQLAVGRGATVIGTASPANHDYLRSLGAHPVAYGDGLAGRVRRAAPQGIDAALDLVGGPAVTTSLELVADPGRVGTTVDDEAAQRYGVRRLRGARSRAVLAELADRVAAGRLRVAMAGAYPLSLAAEAHRQVDTGHVRGKVVLLAG